MRQARLRHTRPGANLGAEPRPDPTPLPPLPGGLGLFARSKIAKERKESAGPAVAKLLASGMGEVDAATLAVVATEYGAPAPTYGEAPPLPPQNARAGLLRLLGAPTPPWDAWWRWVPRHNQREAGPLSAHPRSGPRACRL